MNITGIDLEAIAEAAAYRHLAYQVTLTLMVLLAVYVIAKREEQND